MTTLSDTAPGADQRTPGGEAPSGTIASPAATVARKEWLDLRRDSRWRAFLALTLLLMAASLATGLAQVRRLDRERALAERGDRDAWTGQGAKNPHSAAHFGQYAFKPAGPLALADPGVDAYVGNATYLEAHKQNEVQFRAARDATLAARMGRLTPAFVLQTIVPLMAVLLGFSAFSGEREKGTLAQLMSLGVRPTDLLLGKAAAGAGVLLGLLALACAGLAVGAAFATPGGGAVASDALRTAGLFVAYALYVLGFLALALAASARARSSRGALVGLLGFWLLNTFVAPRVATELAARAAPLPTAQAFRDGIAADKRALFGHDESHPGFVAFRDRVLREHGVSRVEDLPVSFRGLSLREDDHAGYRIFDRHFGRLEAAVERQDALRSLAGFLFPMLALQPLSMAMAGTDNRHHHDFVHAAEAHRRLIQDEASRDLIEHARNGDESYVAPASLWEDIPAFRYERPSAAWAWRGRARDLAALALWAAACGLMAWRSSLRLRPL